jgi:Tfp pilus assembly protein PilX
MKQSLKRRNNQYGAVSLFIVIFTMLLVTVITISFARLMLNDQRQATAADLSQSAYDSAMAGVEDGKRALIYYQKQCSSGSDRGACEDAQRKIQTESGVETDCNVAVSAVLGVTGTDIGKEVLIKQDQLGNDTKLNQAYTCVKITLNTPNYLGTLDKDASKMVPLVGVADNNGRYQYDTVRIEWFNSDDLPVDKSTKLDLPNVSNTDDKTKLLTSSDDWGGINRPPVMRAQLIQFSSSNDPNTGFTLDSFNRGQNTNTLFLYPSSNGVTSDINMGLATRIGQPIKTPTVIKCSDGSEYACSATIKLPNPENGDKTNRVAYLYLEALYKKANFRVTLIDSSKVGSVNDGHVDFDSVQPSIDSTGRANDLFRRVVSRVDFMDINFPYPQAAVDVGGDFCKNFSITDASGDYNGSANGTCTP